MAQTARAKQRARLAVTGELTMTPGGRATWKDGEELRWAARHWAARIGVILREVHVRPMRTKWASISTSGRLTLDASLIGLPRELGDFAIVHELVHLLCPTSGHGKVFQAFMVAYLPDWEEREVRLQRHIPQPIDDR